MTPEPHVLAIDLGTSNLKVALVGLGGRIAAATSRSIETIHNPGGAAEQDPEAIWQSVIDASAQVIGSCDVPRAAVSAILPSSQFFSLLPVDDSGHPVARMQLWMSRLGATHSERLLADHPEGLVRFLEIHGALPFGNDSLSHALHLQNDRPDVWDATRALIEPADFLTLRLSGELTSNLCTAFPLMLTDNRDLEANCWSTELLALAGIPETKLAPLVPVDARVGGLLPAIAERIGLPAGVPIFAGTNDTQAVTIGAGAFRPGCGGLNIGTTIQVLGAADAKKTDIESQIVSMPSPFPGEYLAMGECGLGGRLVEHFLANIAYAEDGLGDHRVEDLFERIEPTIAAEPAGSGRLLYLPWLSGSMAPAESSVARGGFLNMNLATTRSRMLRAVLEGVGYQLHWMLPSVEAFAGANFEDITFSGGGARSPSWASLLADIINKPIRRIADAGHVNTRGVAFLAFERLGLTDRESIETFRPTAEIHEPRAQNREIYDGLFSAWRAAFDANLPVFEVLQGLEIENPHN